jgi:hypothetical protein
MEKMKRILFEELDYQMQGADIYNTKTSKWLIFTDSKKWVLEYTNSNTLWFNYTFFKNTLIFFGMDCADADSKNMIKEWFESRFLEKNIAHVTDTSYIPYSIVENVVQNGVKHTYKKKITRLNEVEDTIQNGVKDTQEYYLDCKSSVEDVIQNGVKYTMDSKWTDLDQISDTIQNGVKDAQSVDDSYFINEAEYQGRKVQLGKIMQGDIKKFKVYVKNDKGKVVKVNFGFGGESLKLVEDVIQNGVKEVKTPLGPQRLQVEDAIQNGVKNVMENRLIRSTCVYNTIQNGVKDIGHFDMDDNIIAEDVIQNGVKEVKSVYLRSCLGVGDAIQNGVKHMMWSNDDDDVEEVIQNGVKEVKERLVESLEQKDHMVTNAIITEDINYAIENGVKE